MMNLKILLLLSIASFTAYTQAALGFYSNIKNESNFLSKEDNLNIPLENDNELKCNNLRHSNPESNNHIESIGNTQAENEDRNISNFELDDLITDFEDQKLQESTQRMLAAARIIDIDNFDSHIVTITGGSTGDKKGYKVTQLADINGDGKDDYAISAPYAASNKGVVYIVLGGGPLTNIYLSALSMTSSPKGFTITGKAAGDLLGSSLESAGDFNKDGYGDIIIGAPGAAPLGRVGAGAAYVIYGADTASLDNIDLGSNSGLGLVIIQGRAGSGLGTSVLGIGDLDNDGYSDIAVGAPNTSPWNRNNAGSVYTIYGQANLSPNIVDAASFDAKGAKINIANSIGAPVYFSIAGGGDFNGDGFADIVIQPFPASRGYHLIFGRTLPLPSKDNALTQQITTSSGLFHSIDIAGDINNDGYDDMIWGSICSTPKPTTYIYKGGSSSDLSSPWAQTVHGPGTCGTSLYSSYIVGDINKDGYDDIMIGSTKYSAIYVIYGSSSGIPDIGDAFDYSKGVAALSSTGKGFAIQNDPGKSKGVSQNAFGRAGDVNGDGYADIIIKDDSKSIAYVIYGGNNLEDFAYADLATLSSTGKGFTIATVTGLMSGAGDINNDSYDDLIIGATNNNAYVIYGGNNLADLTVLTSLSTTGKGFSIAISLSALARAGDINDDGYSDIILRKSNLAYVIFGGSSLTDFSSNDINTLSATGKGFTMPANSPQGVTASTLSAGGDINGDGIDDVLAYGNNANFYIVFGSKERFSDFTANSFTTYSGGFVTHGGQPGDKLGSSLGKVGDINDDGIDDFLIAASDASLPGRTNAGIVYILKGKDSQKESTMGFDLRFIDKTPFKKISGSSSGDKIGISIRSIGDIDKNGINDFIIGAPYASSQAGVTYLLYGDKTAYDNHIDLNSYSGVITTITGAAANDLSGTSLSNLGDINNDGVNDFIVGAPGAYNGAGASYLILSNNPNIGTATLNLATLDDTQGFILKGGNDGDCSGSSLSGGLDIDGDGLNNDIIIGASCANSDKGIVYILSNKAPKSTGFYFVTDPGSVATIGLSTYISDANGSDDIKKIRFNTLPSSGIVEVDNIQAVANTDYSTSSQFAYTAPGSIETYSIVYEIVDYFGWSSSSAEILAVICLDNYFVEDSGTSKRCSACPTASTSSLGDVTCTCNTNFVSSGSGSTLVCTCPDNYFIGGSGNTQTCSPCREHAISESEDTLCLCASGFHSLTSEGDCIICPADSYCEGETAIEACAAGTHSKLGSTSSTACLGEDDKTSKGIF